MKKTNSVSYVSRQNETPNDLNLITTENGNTIFKSKSTGILYIVYTKLRSKELALKELKV